MGLFDINHPWLCVGARSGGCVRRINPVIGEFSLYWKTRQRLILQSFFLPSMNTATPWVPAIHGNSLPPLRRLGPVLENGDLPSVKRDIQWVRSTVRSSVGPNPNAEPSLWETVLNLWRLGQVESCEEDDGEDSLWSEYVRAWLVRNTLSSGGRSVLMVEPLCRPVTPTSVDSPRLMSIP